jgi:hypothetical protein
MPQIRSSGSAAACSQAPKNGCDADERLFGLADVAPFPRGDLIG